MRKRRSAMGIGLLALMAVWAMASSAAAEEHLGEFSSAGYPAALVGTQIGTHTFQTEAWTVKCSTATLSGTLAAKSGELTVAPNYEKCTFGLAAIEFKANGCTYNLRSGFEIAGSEFDGLVDLNCPVGKKMTFTAPLTGCQVAVTPEKGLDELKFVTTGGVDFKVVFIKTGFSYTVNKECKVPVMEYHNGIYTGETTMKGNNGAVAVG